MDKQRHVVTMVVSDQDTAYEPVSKLLHDYAPSILLRVGYPMRDKNVSVIFLIIELSIDEMGAFAGSLGQMKAVKVKTIKLNIE